MKTRLGWKALAIGGVLSGMLAGAASAQQLSYENCDDDGDVLWLMNGNQMLLDDFRSLDTWYLHLPPETFQGVELRSDRVETGLIGDLTVHADGLRVSLDLRNFLFVSFFGDPIDPSSRPIILELHDEGDPENFQDNVSVWFRGSPMPSMEEGWLHYEFTIPVPAGDEMPEGWGGTGAEDPVTFEPKLPDGRTFRSVLQNVTLARVSTFEPGYSYGPSGVEFGADNITVVAITDETCPCDVDGGGLQVTDIFAYLIRIPTGTRARLAHDRDLRHGS